MDLVIRACPCVIGRPHCVEGGEGAKEEENTDLVVRVCIYVIGRLHIVTVGRESRRKVYGPGVTPKSSSAFPLFTRERVKDSEKHRQKDLICMYYYLFELR